jgi:CRP-like cAMP-binding protein
MTSTKEDQCAACPLHEVCYVYNYFPDEFHSSIVSRKVPAGTTIISQGASSGGIYFLCKGQVKVFRSYASGDIVIRDILVGAQFISYKAALLNENHLYSAQTLTSSEILMLPKGELNTLRDNHTVLKSFMAQQLYDYRNFEAALGMYTVDQANRKIERILVYLYAMQKRARKNNPEQIRYTRAMLADFAALTPETVVRQLKSLEEQNLVYLQGRLIVIKDKLIEKYKQTFERYTEPIRKRIET